MGRRKLGIDLFIYGKFDLAEVGNRMTANQEQSVLLLPNTTQKDQSPLSLCFLPKSLHVPHLKYLMFLKQTQLKKI